MRLSWVMSFFLLSVICPFNQLAFERASSTQKTAVLLAEMVPSRLLEYFTQYLNVISTDSSFVFSDEGLVDAIRKVGMTGKELTRSVD